MGRWQIAVRGLTLAMLLVAVVGGSVSSVAAQTSPGPVGSVPARPSSPVVPTPAPIGGLRTRPLGAGATVSGVKQFRFGSTVLLSVADAPVLHGGIVVNARREAVSRLNAAGAVWMPTTEPPRWTRDSTLAQVQAWRDLIVTDVMCSGLGECVERRQRVRARWVAGCRCYAFADGWNRIWRVD